MTDYIIKASYRNAGHTGLPVKVTIHRATCVAGHTYSRRSKARLVTREQARDALGYAERCRRCNPDLEDA